MSKKPPRRRTPRFVDPNKDPQHYINRYYKEPKYKEWFDRNYPDWTIEEAVGLIASKPKKSGKKSEKIFVIAMVILVVIAFFFFQDSDTLFGSLIAQTTPPDWDEVTKRNIVMQSIPIVLLEEEGERCKVGADNFDIIIDHRYFLRGEELAAQLNFDRESETLGLPCDLLTGEKTRLVIWYATEEAENHATKFEYWTEEWIGQDIIKVPNTVVITPVFTALAYSKGGFYEYYNGTCDESCLVMEMPDEVIPKFKSSSYNGFAILVEGMGFPYVTDKTVDQNPEVLSEYGKVILLHNEYVTAREFEAITNHPNVIYLYPNALYAEVSVDYDKNTMTLVRGHGYPSPEIANGFDWEFDNTHPFEYDTECENWKFYEIDNGRMLNCYPEDLIVEDEFFRETILGL